MQFENTCHIHHQSVRAHVVRNQIKAIMQRWGKALACDDCQVRYLSDNLKKIVDPVIQRNAYFSHPENVLLAILTDSRPHIRQLGLQRILKVRSTEMSGEHVRKFCIPRLNFDAVNYEDMIDWSSADTPVTEPPVMMRMTDTELKDLIKADVNPTVLCDSTGCGEMCEACDGGVGRRLRPKIPRWTYSR